MKKQQRVWVVSYEDRDDGVGNEVIVCRTLARALREVRVLKFQVREEAHGWTVVRRDRLWVDDDEGQKSIDISHTRVLD